MPDTTRLPEWVLPDPAGTEAAVHVGVLHRAGDIVVSCHDANGIGASAYLTPDEARRMAAALIERADEADRGR